MLLCKFHNPDDSSNNGEPVYIQTHDLGTIAETGRLGRYTALKTIYLQIGLLHSEVFMIIIFNLNENL